MSGGLQVMSLKPTDIYERYSRQILFPPIGEKGQQKLLQSSVTIMGLGALGMFVPAALPGPGLVISSW